MTVRLGDGLMNDRTLDIEAARPLWDYLAVDDGPAPADVIFVFGSRDLLVPARAAALYHAGHAARLLVTGGYGPMTRGVFAKAEALVFADCLVDRGVPTSSIVIETEATNTLENVRFGMAALARSGARPGSALLVAKGFVMRRCVATFAQHHPAVLVRACPPRGGVASGLDRHPQAFVDRLAAEIDRLDRYAARGHIRPQAIPPGVRLIHRRVTESRTHEGPIPESARWRTW